MIFTRAEREVKTGMAYSSLDTKIISLTNTVTPQTRDFMSDLNGGENRN